MSSPSLSELRADSQNRIECIRRALRNQRNQASTDRSQLPFAHMGEVLIEKIYAASRSRSRLIEQSQNCHRQSCLARSALAHESNRFIRENLQCRTAQNAFFAWVIDRDLDRQQRFSRGIG